MQQEHGQTGSLIEYAQAEPIEVHLDRSDGNDFHPATLSALRRTLAPRGETAGMLLKRHSPRIEADLPPVVPHQGFEHLDPRALATLRWLKGHRVEFVLTGAVAEAVHRRSPTKGPVAIVPAPYRRNLERLARGLTSAQARVRNDQPALDTATPARVTVESLSGPEVWTFAYGSHRVDVVGVAAPGASGSSGASDYQELLYEANRFELGPDLTVEVASPEDIEHYIHLRRTGTAPEIKISRQSQEAPADSGPAPTAAPGRDSLPDSG